MIYYMNEKGEPRSGAARREEEWAGRTGSAERRRAAKCLHDAGFPKITWWRAMFELWIKVLQCHLVSVAFAIRVIRSWVPLGSPCVLWWTRCGWISLVGGRKQHHTTKTPIFFSSFSFSPHSLLLILLSSIFCFKPKLVHIQILVCLNCWR